MLSAQVIYWNQKDMACPIQYLPQVSRCEKIRKITLQAATAAFAMGRLWLSRLTLIARQIWLWLS